MTTTWILHMDIDAFFASVEKVRNPRLIGKPVIVGSGVIASCCYTARRRGLSAGMSLKEARRCCPDVIILAGNQPVYRAFAERVWEICHDFTPAVESLLDDAYLDITGSQWLYGSPRRLGMLLRQRVRQETGLTVTAGVGSSRVVARLASAGAKPNGLGWVEPGAEAAFLADLPVAKLPGVGRKRASILHKLNVHTIGALRALPLGALEQLFGAQGAALYERARGRDSQVLTTREIPRTLSRETSFHADTTDRCEIEGMLYYLIERAMKTLRQLHLTVKTLAVKIRYGDGVFDKRSRRLAQPTRSDSLAFEQARSLLETIHTRRVALHGIGVALSGLALAGAVQQELFADPGRRFHDDLYPALDAVRQKYGYRALVAGPSIHLLNRLPQDDHGFVLRTPSLTK
jgi:DNA polymerase-4